MNFLSSRGRELTSYLENVLLEVALGERWVVREEVAEACGRAWNELVSLKREKANGLSLLTSAQINLDESQKELAELKKKFFEREEFVGRAKDLLRAGAAQLDEQKAKLDEQEAVIRQLRKEKYEADSRVNQAEQRLSQTARKLAEKETVISAVKEMLG
jgi:chromosome segregation ATPase